LLVSLDNFVCALLSLNPVKRLENANEDAARYPFEGHRELQETKRPLDHREHLIWFELEVHGREVPREAHQQEETKEWFLEESVQVSWYEE